MPNPKLQLSRTPRTPTPPRTLLGIACCDTSGDGEARNDFSGARFEVMIQHVANMVSELSAQNKELHDDISNKVSHLYNVLGVRQASPNSAVLHSLASGPPPPSEIENGAGGQASSSASRCKPPALTTAVTMQSNGNEVAAEATRPEDCKINFSKSPDGSKSGIISGTTSKTQSSLPGSSDSPSRSVSNPFRRKNRIPTGNSGITHDDAANYTMFPSSQIFSREILEDIQTPVPPLADGTLPWLRAWCLRIIEKPYFDQAIGLMIFVNAICIGWETQTEIDGDAPIFLIVLENVFLVIYIIEIIMRFLGCGIRACLHNAWIVFDIFLVLLGCISSWIIEPHFESEEGQQSSAAKVMKPILVLRVLRLLRLLRALRLFQSFKYLWRLVQGLLHCFPTMASTGFLLLGTIYVFSCISVEIVTKNETLLDDAFLRKIINEKFASLPGTMLTLFQFATLDSIASVYEPIIYKQPSLFLFYFPVLLIVSIALMNLVTAVLVEASIDNGKIDREMQKNNLRRLTKKLIPQIEEAFQALDVSGDGFIDKQEVARSARELPDVLTRIIRPENLQELFDMLDIDGSGRVDSEEFVQGILNLAVSDVSIETQQTLKLLRIIRRKSEDTDRRVKKLEKYIKIEGVSAITGVYPI